jgi:hypothetical protein
MNSRVGSRAARPRVWVSGLLGLLLLAGCGRSLEAACEGEARGASVLFLAAQGIPSAAYVPCIVHFPVGWTFGGSETESGLFRFWLDSDRAGAQAVEVILERSCDTRSAVEVPSPPGAPVEMQRFEKPLSLRPRFALDRFDVFPGGCVTYRFEFESGAPPALVFEMNEALSLVSRADGVRVVREEFGLELCGAGARPCPG